MRCYPAVMLAVRGGPVRDLFMNFSLGARIGMIVGIIAAALGAGVAIAAAGLPGAILVAVMLGVMVVVFWIVLAPQARRNKLARTGVPAEAVILSVAETGWTLNGNYGLARLRLQVEPADGGDPVRGHGQVVHQPVRDPLLPARRASAGGRRPF